VDINPKIFREYDIRGIVGQDLDESIVETLGRAMAARRMSPSGVTAG
jgi:phosphomannomutase